jgi:hypothetical protein
VGHVGDPDGADSVAVLGHDADRVAVVAELEVVGRVVDAHDGLAGAVDVRELGARRRR